MSKQKMTKQYNAVIVFADGRKWNAVKVAEGITSKKQYATTLTEARGYIKKCLAMYNKQYTYDENGNRYETDAIGFLGATVTIPREYDEKDRIVETHIYCRTVTEWQEV